MWRFIKFLFVLTALAVVGFVGFAYLGPIFSPADFTPTIEQVVKPVTLGGDG